MIYVPKNFNTKEKNACLKALTYILNLNSARRQARREYLSLQMKALNIAEDKYKETQSACKMDAVVKALQGLDNLRVQRYIIREMIMLSVADQDISDEEIRHIYQIAEAIGISGEKVGDFFIWAAKGIEWWLVGIQLVEEDL